MSEDLREQLGEVRARVDERWEELEPRRRRAQVGVLTAAQQLVTALLILPRILVRLLGAVADVTDRLAGPSQELTARARAAAEVGADRGAELADRARDLAAALPVRAEVVTARSRRRRRLTILGVLAAGFSAGAALGWVLGRRRVPAEVRYDPLVSVVDADPTPLSSEVEADAGAETVADAVEGEAADPAT